jgi:hypothetical protein
MVYNSDGQLAARGPDPVRGFIYSGPPPRHRFGSIGESFNICLILLVQRKI